MRRLLLALPIALLIAGAALGAGFFLMEDREANTPRVMACSGLEQEPTAEKPLANAPLDAPVLEPTPASTEGEQNALSEIPAPEVTPPAPVVTPEETPKLVDKAKELQEALQSEKLTEEEKLARLNELKEIANQLREELAKYQVTLKGVVNDYYGQPLEGAQILVKSNEVTTRKRPESARVLATTAADGTFEAAISSQVLEDASFEVEIQAYAPMAMYTDVQKLSVSTGQVYEGLVFTMPQAGAITGRVVDQNFAPIAGARVSAGITGLRERKSGARPQGAATDADGRFTIKGLVSGNFTVTVKVEGYSPQGTWPTIDVTPGEPMPLAGDIVMNTQTSLRVSFSSAGSPLKGRVNAIFYDSDGKQTNISATAEKDGKALFSPAPDNAIEVEFIKSGYLKTARVAVSPIAGTHADLAEVTMEVDPDAKKYPNRGKGLDHADSLPDPGTVPGGKD